VVAADICVKSPNRLLCYLLFPNIGGHTLRSRDNNRPRLTARPASRAMTDPAAVRVDVEEAQGRSVSRDRNSCEKCPFLFDLGRKECRSIRSFQSVDHQRYGLVAKTSLRERRWSVRCCVFFASRDENVPWHYGWVVNFQKDLEFECGVSALGMRLLIDELRFRSIVNMDRSSTSGPICSSSSLFNVRYTLII
jgi:hypothetical protein